jgi:hypothetical protein
MELALLILFVVAWIARERFFDNERKTWARERGLLLNRIKPETAQPVDDSPPESFNTLPFDGPDADETYWENVSNN